METLHYACCLSIHRGGFGAQHGGPETRKNNEGQTHVGASSAASDPWRVCVWRMFPECRFYRLCGIFLLFLVQLKFPEGRAKNKTAGQRIPWFFT